MLTGLSDYRITGAEFDEVANKRLYLHDISFTVTFECPDEVFQLLAQCTPSRNAVTGDVARGYDNYENIWYPDDDAIPVEDVPLFAEHELVY